MGWVVIFAVLAACGGDDDHAAAADSSSGGPAAGMEATAGMGDSSGGARAGQSGSKAPGNTTTYGQIYAGGEFHLGPVDWNESQWHNACAPASGYAKAIREVEGQLLAGIWNGLDDVGQYCDACIHVTTARGKSALLRVVTYGDTSRNSIDVSQNAFEILDSGDYPRAMSWQFAKCEASGPVHYEFQTGSSQWWTSLWVRNARVPLAKVEVKSTNHPSYVELERGGDGTLTDGGGFGEGAFSVRLTGIDGTQITDSFDWPRAGVAGALLKGKSNFQ